MNEIEEYPSVMKRQINLAVMKEKYPNACNKLVKWAGFNPMHYDEPYFRFFEEMGIEKGGYVSFEEAFKLLEQLVVSKK